jgi:hypothetical protein
MTSATNANSYELSAKDIIELRYLFKNENPDALGEFFEWVRLSDSGLGTEAEESFESARAFVQKLINYSRDHSIELLINIYQIYLLCGQVCRHEELFRHFMLVNSGSAENIPQPMPELMHYIYIYRLLYLNQFSALIAYSNHIQSPGMNNAIRLFAEFLFKDQPKKLEELKKSLSSAEAKWTPLEA